MVPRIPGTLRGLSTSAKVHLQHVLYFGDVLGYNSVQRFAKLPRAWIDAVGASADIDHGVAFTHAAGSPTHSMLSYTLLDTSLNPGPRRQATLDPTTNAAAEEAVEEGEVIGEEPRRRIAQSKVFALGRNTHAQLGLGFASQEATRGMVTGDIAGKGGITHVAAGTGFSFVVAADEGESNVYGFGNDTLGQLGSCTQMEERRTDAYDVSTRLEASDAPQLRLLPLPKRIPLDGWSVRSIATGIDHTLLLVERNVAGHLVQEVLSTGLNTDGQLGVTPADRADAVPIQPLISRTFTRVPLSLPAEEMVAVVCGADTSYVLLRNGDLYAWGNSEYAQTLAGTHDRITHPTHISNPLIDAYTSADLPFNAHAPPKVKKIVAGGSFAVLLDTHHRVWTVGYGVGNLTSAEKLTLVEGLPQGRVEDIWAGLEYVLATTREEDGQLKVWVWGVLPRSIATVPVTTPMQVPFAVPKSPRQQYLDENPTLKNGSEEEMDGGKVGVIAAACTRDHVIVVMDDGMGEDVWAECVQPPRDKGTDVV
ncbi:uncharacterized protein PSANT_04418 [Moesziomyces antarcticus]|uniref:RCC1/BLIP-II n=1 Tax=Pseudozyma antarctica TaxID=84753 RepID=A0A5C3FR05_PSEA2|nr:uncharacterized protein PSANT_04418 [Moesziomyces antarcticus]